MWPGAQNHYVRMRQVLQMSVIVLKRLNLTLACKYSFFTEESQLFLGFGSKTGAGVQALTETMQVH